MSEQPGPLPVDLDTLAARIDAACNGARHGLDVEANLALTDEERQGALGFVAMAFLYMEGHSGATFFGPQVELADGTQLPPPLDSVAEEGAILLQALADRVSAAIARARLNDLCFEGHWGHGGVRARAAAAGYRDASDIDPYVLSEPDRMYATLNRVTWLRRALVLSRLIHDEELAARTIEAVEEAAQASLAQPHQELGVTLGHIETLVQDGQSDHVDDLLNEARLRFAGGDGHHTADITALQIRRAGSDDKRRRELQRELVVNWLDHADRHTGLVRMHFLELASQLARDFGIGDLTDRAIGELQQIKPEELDLVRVPYAFELPADWIERYIAELTGQPDWREAFLMLIAGAPSGRAEDNRSSAVMISSQAPLSSIIPRTTLGPDGLPKVTASSDEERAEQRLVDVEMTNARINGAITVRALARIWATYGPISEADFADFFAQAPHVEPSLAGAIARAFLRFFEGDIEGATFTALPRTEALARELALRLNLPIYRTQLPRTPGQYPGLGSVLSELRQAGLDESWFRFLNGYLANPGGGNVRNDALHGFVNEPSAETAALTLVAALYLALGPVPQI